MRKIIIARTKKVVIKVGTGVLTQGSSTEKLGINIYWVRELVKQIAALRKAKRDVILVTSGAIGLGCSTLGFCQKPTSIPTKQAAAAVGQIKLMHLYEKKFSRHDIKVAQLLLTQEVVDNRTQFLNTRNTILKLLEYGIIPIINENDTVAVEEIRLGDNDNLAAIVANLAEADLVLNLSTVDGLYRDLKRREVVDEVDKITPEIKNLARREFTRFGTGGMPSKLEAAEKIMAAGGAMIIANGLHAKVITKIFLGERVGTIFFPGKRKLSHKRRWIAYTKSVRGVISIDQGAVIALVEKGTSLLPIGIEAVSGDFEAGDMVKVINNEDNEIARGLVNYSAAQVKKIMGNKSSEIGKILGETEKGYEEVIHRDNLVLT